MRWRTYGEPLALTILVLLGISLVPLRLLGLLTSLQLQQSAIVLAWVAVSLLVLRLPALLQRESRRLGLLVGMVALAGVILVVTALPPAASAQSQGLTFRATPRISQTNFSRILANAGSPAAPYGNELYDIIRGYGLDPAVALAFFQHESQYCTTGRCARSGLQNWGMLRRHIKQERNAGLVDGFARYATWQDGARDWSELMLGYVNRGMDTVEKAVPVYAPTSDGNVPTAYINAIRRQVASWSGSANAGADVALRAYTGPLDQALISETFLASSVVYYPNWAFHQYMLAEARAGRPLGVPMDESRIIMLDGQRFAVQVFALDTLYTPIAPVESQTNWSDVRRLSDLLAPPLAPAPTVTPQVGPGR
ncbi:glucosaminidase domain-containing protein [Candidatus Chloroploca sp. Khr17]|uniref:glucosaminidase domain-containing protein n=1 Tax=Candidatus Chloroploca sp. Khr17 TaxID=2496869 RepID=UPI00101D2CA7|nr:glucosaminidase domain-containing protein [Candidatus Chloroploca sp. Khr17]